jgi:alanyl-tRNA synthetase
MTNQQIRQLFFDFFSSKQHKIIPSAPMVIKDDPTLMFTNAGMNQFKDIFLGNKATEVSRIANSQKCLRVSGKHNDLEEVGHDTYHHTMFEMLGNWSFGDYFKREAVDWAWELLTVVYGLDKRRLYATVFGGDESDGLESDLEAKGYWQQWLPDNQILYGSRKDNFWEMGDTGPCGPCSEIHIDLRSDQERETVSGAELVNSDHPLVVEVWNLVFIQYNRKADNSLVPLPDKHVDTGMGFERLCMALQKKTSNYDTDIFQPLIAELGRLSGKVYGENEKENIAFRVIADHVRAVAFSIADGQLPSNVKAGYVIRRILRRAIRYGYTFLGFTEPFINRLVPVLTEQMGPFFPELKAQESLIMRVITEEENAFLRTLENGINLLEGMMKSLREKSMHTLDGDTAFVLYDTYGFPADLTALILSEHGMQMDHDGFACAMEVQKSRSRDAARVEADDWVVVHQEKEEGFLGYDHTEAEVKVLRYRRVLVRDQEQYQLVLNRTPFYAEAGGQVGDTGDLADLTTTDTIEILNTRSENQLVVHVTDKLPANPSSAFLARVDTTRRAATERNHTATHLLHYALREVLGTHVEQKGSLVHPEYLRFDFSHFGKMTLEEIQRTEQIVNDLILDSVLRDEQRSIALEEAKTMGAMSLFGEKYGDTVRVIRFGDSVELCGGTHVRNTGEIGLFKILSEGAIAAGIRRIEAITGRAARQFYEEQLQTVIRFRELLRNPKEPVKSLEQLLEKQRRLESELEAFSKVQAESGLRELLATAESVNGIRFIGGESVLQPAAVKDIAFSLRESERKLVMILTGVHDGKAMVSVFVSPDVVKSHNLSASAMIKTIAPFIQGGGGGQDFFATAGGKNPTGLENAIQAVRELIGQANG